MRFLFVDRIVETLPGEYIRGIKHVTADDVFLTVDEENRPCFIPSLIGETLGQLAAWNIMELQGFTHRPVAGIVARALMHRSAYVGETLLLESFIEHVDDAAMHYRSEARVGDELVFSIEGALGPLLPMDDFIDLDKVKQQFAEINYPGDWFALCKESDLASQKQRLIKCSLPRMMMNFDSIRSCQPGVHLIAEKRISLAAPYFPDHFPKKPVLPMTVLLECKLNLAHEFVARAELSSDYQIRELRKIKMNEFIRPGSIIECCITVKKQEENELILACRSQVEGKRVCVVDIVLVPRKRTSEKNITSKAHLWK